jgi:hypothetical protein
MVPPGVSTNTILHWSGSSESATYHLQISTSADFATTKFDKDVLTKTSRSVTDLEPNTLHYWRVRAGSVDAVSDWSTIWRFTTGSSSTVGKNPSEIPDRYALGQNYPNPFNPTTLIPFALPEASFVSLVIYDLLGRKIRTLVSDELMSGAFHTVVWNGRNDDGHPVSSGVYLYRINANAYTASKRMLFIQ